MTDQTEREAFVTIPMELALDIKEHLFCYALYLDYRRETEDAQTVKNATRQMQQAISAARASLQGGERVCKCADHVSNSVVPPRSKECLEFLSHPGNSYCLRCGHHVACHARKEG